MSIQSILVLIWSHSDHVESGLVPLGPFRVGFDPTGTVWGRIWSHWDHLWSDLVPLGPFMVGFAPTGSFRVGFGPIGTVWGRGGVGRAAG